MEQTDSRSRRFSSRSRRAAAAAILFLAGGAGALRAQAPPENAQIVIGDTSQRIAIPDCVPSGGDQASREACRTLTQVLRRDLQFENRFRFVPENLMASLPAMNPDA